MVVDMNPYNSMFTEDQQRDTAEMLRCQSKVPRMHCIGVNRPAIVREIPHFGLFPAFLRKRPAFLALFRNNKNR